MRRFAGITAVAAVLGLSACTADPPPPIEQTEPTRTPAPVPQLNTVVVAVDDVGAGFNPHLLADQSPVGNTVAGMVLPSAFRPVPDPARPGATVWMLDESVLVSADVTSQAPFTITYQVRDEAQWSDSAPIAAEDFRYLWQQMITEPGVVDPAGYRLIEDVGSSGGGKTVTVTLREPYPAWRELFTHLLPAHLVKDTPGGFATSLAESIPVSGGQFHVRSVDRGRGEILLERNDRFWGTPARPDRILLRRGGTDAQLAESMRTGDAQVAQMHGGGSALLAQLGAIPHVRTGTQLQPRVLELTLNGRTTEFADPRVRRAVLGLLDPDLLATVAAGTESAVVAARAQVLAPSDPGYAPSMPPRPGREESLALLAAAGYVPADPATVEATGTPVPEAATTGLLAHGDAPLALVLGVPENSPVADAVAHTAADQLRGAGVAATVTTLPPDELYGEALVRGTVHAVVGWTRAGGDPATAAMSRFGCPPAIPGQGSPPVEPDPAPAPDSGTVPGADTAPGGDTVPDDEIEAAEAQLAAPSNVSGVCDPALEPELAGALRGAGDVPAVLAGAQPKLWDLAVTLPILQDRTVIAAGPGVEGVTLTGAIPAGPLSDAQNWWRTTP
ncbi:monoacyl phosphatidylinositol tetramannoside-binding protein [Rhodococcus ruber Chol-4]|uniref:ABC transporter family substrate-binding protein n=1 Tax=Rhodococcus ruber TaxID=1830 RepID=UPI00076BA58A|nr:ABC transporter family substrate-binding protein [Rhodococcus ruber]KXF88076.1 monoacyl phosphatidylinositol tetramannoside-binding protein [Rhodococcus ruber Chol-4]